MSPPDGPAGRPGISRRQSRTCAGTRHNSHVPTRNSL
ncbi:hypothetical protein BU14_0400s0013 [Porphyra umbilicalis]|uniref:Uncharacterized protein n=1 Tax=Porphyra umbilicalis TaxID=2786 RepID=A0A1X6NW57_PORUM|nr:hypothetical protein BU14_0400s0013 [Porphyra umbilicalis]|eukprot:OSX72854.1 hypothetical protein BU14_0400s0013 [Porphyra umbilicalis]